MSSPEPTRNLVIVHTRGFQSREDWEEVKLRIAERAPDIETRIVDNLLPNSATRRWQVRRPSLVFSPVRLREYRPAGGTIYAGHWIDKLAQYNRLKGAGVAAPRTVALSPHRKLDPARWGEFVIVKPSGFGSSKGRNVRLVRTADVARRFVELSEGGELEMAVQRFVDGTDETGRHHEWRVCTMFGRPIYMQLGIAREPRVPLARVADELGGEIAFNRIGVKRELRLEVDEDVLALAQQAARAIKEAPCLGMDIVRERETGTLYVLELNAGGNVWHMSSNEGRGATEEYRAGMYAQFSALDTAADVLIERTRAEAT